MKKVAGKIFDEERALYNLTDTLVCNCRFEGDADGESALKECRNIAVEDCFFDLRYPLWHAADCCITGSVMSENCRAALWYDRNIAISHSTLQGIKALRECEGVVLKDDQIDSAEFGWRCKDVQADRVWLMSEYPFFENRNLTIRELHLKGKYSFQYGQNLQIEDSILDTKDALWHAQHAVLRNCIVKGEYLAWYARDLTFENCIIQGTQPFCYCENITLTNCTMEGCDLAFERSSHLQVSLKGSMESIKNPLSGSITADQIHEIIFDWPQADPACVQIEQRR